MSQALAPSSSVVTATVEGPKILSAKNRILEKIAVGCSIPELLGEVADLSESLAPGWSIAVHLVDPEAGRLTAGLTRSVSSAVSREMERIPLSDDWPVGRALAGPEASGPYDSKAYRELAMRHGLSHCRVFPAVATRGPVIATITAFTVDEPTAVSLPDSILGTVASLLAMGVVRLRAIERLRLAQTSIDQSLQPAVCLRADGAFVYVNEAACAAFGYDRRELLSKKAYELDPKGTAVRYQRLFRIAARRRARSFETSIRRGDGRVVPVEIAATFVQIDREQFLCVLIRDLSVEKQTEARLKESEERFALAARGANDGLWDWNLETNELLLSPRFRAIVGLEEREQRTSREEWFRLIHPEDVAVVRKRIRSHLDGDHGVFESEHRMVHVDGRQIWVLARGEAVREKSGRALRIAGSLTDITKQKLIEDRLRRDAAHDDLTGLPNRAALMEHLRRLVSRAKRSEREFRFAVLFLDFDRFKRINDSLGHMAGDQLLVAIAQRLGQCVRPGDNVARLGGDEFAIILEPVNDVTEATRVSERVHQALREPFQIHGVEVLITTSIGIALGSRAYDRPEDVLRDADTAMYRAKAAGKARHEIFDTAMHARAVEALQLEAELHRAVLREEFRLLYQPIVSLDDRVPRGLEVLTRWQHPVKGTLSPSIFLPAAEETGIIVEIGWWGLIESCSQMARWLETSPGNPLTLHVNLSDKQLFEPDLPGRIERILADAGLPASHLVLDVAETVIMQKAESSVAILGQLKSLGLSIHMDDFGTGYSSLGYLHRFEIDALKIDRSFVRHLRVGGDNWTAVRTIVGLAESLAMEVIAEGVETEEQLDGLLALGCTLGQGSLFHEPLRSERISDLLAPA